ncbi:MAG: nuclear transport factor 2 family protein [Azospirillum sp.]|nr:nuclear transport factor 2 family protein [Azospirillum sp.]MCA3266371.1 nuclear transport factor 2 family protein [Azospirillum sp.]MCZ8123219.1 nuclear transport factor 2 family protein [Magnetospirillum sp.]
MTEPRDDVLARWYAAIKAGDAAALAQAATPDVRIRWNGPRAAIPWAGEWVGVAGALEFFGLVAQHLTVRRIATVQRIDGPQSCAMVLEGDWEVRRTGEALSLRAANVFAFRDGKVAAYDVYPDSAAFAAALAR